MKTVYKRDLPKELVQFSSEKGISLLLYYILYNFKKKRQIGIPRGPIRRKSRVIFPPKRIIQHPIRAPNLWGHNLDNDIQCFGHRSLEKMERNLEMVVRRNDRGDNLGLIGQRYGFGIFHTYSQT